MVKFVARTLCRVNLMEQHDSVDTQSLRQMNLAGDLMTVHLPSPAG